MVNTTHSGKSWESHFVVAVVVMVVDMDCPGSFFKGRWRLSLCANEGLIRSAQAIFDVLP